MTKAYLEPDEVEQLRNAALYLRDEVLTWLLFRLGCRVSEALAITVNDIDFQRGTITNQNLKGRIKLSCPRCQASLGRSHSFCPRCSLEVVKVIAEEKERSRLRTVPIDVETVTMIQDYVDRGGAIIRNGKQLLFGINRHRAWQIVRECAERAGLPKLVNPETDRIHNVSPHRLGDAFATHAIRVDNSGDGLRPSSRAAWSHEFQQHGQV